MANLVLLVVCFALGVLARRSGALPEDSHRAVNAWAMNVSLPALVFRSIHGAPIDASLLLAAGALWLVFLVPAAVVWALVRRGASRELGAVALCGGLSNTAFVGLPLIEALGGRDALGPAAVVDQLGTFVALFLLAIPWATALRGRSVSFAATVGRVLRAPATVALVLALATRGLAVPDVASAVLGRLADMLSPLALASVGWQLDLGAIRGNAARIAVGLAYKLVLAPAMVAGLLWLARGAIGPHERIAVAQAAMAPMVTAGVVAAEHDLSPRLASALIAVGVPLSFVTVPLWWHLLG